MLVRRFASDLKLELGIVEVGLAITLGPPEVELLLFELGVGVALEPIPCNKRNHRNDKPMHHNEE